ncbi:GspE/PulE family protein [Chloroflexota bacterium]
MQATKEKEIERPDIPVSKTPVANKNLGELLVGSKLITSQQLANALKLQQGDGRELGDILVHQRIITPEDLLAVNSRRLGIPVVDLKYQAVQPEAIDLIPEALARKHNVLPLEVLDGSLVLVMANPEDYQAYQDAQIVSGKRIKPTMALPDTIRQSINRYYKSSEASGQIASYVEKLAEPEALKVKVIDEETTKAVDGPLDRILNHIILEAVEKRASDIHIEPQKNRLRIRYRIDGAIHEVQSLPIKIHLTMISRLKIMAKMNIAERRKPQDGHISLTIEGHDIDIRVATYCTASGEIAVLRLLSKAFTFIELNELGFDPWSLGRYQHLLQSPYGIILVAGPTGSGKTTTLYASINHLRRGACNILTIEDPIEYQFDGVNQGQVNPKAGITFADGLRAMLRLDPDVIVVGEIRDKETAQMAIEAALTGCLVISSIHAGDAARVFSRLIHFGIEPYLISSSVLGVVAQRIVRRVCKDCDIRKEPNQDEAHNYEEEMDEALNHFKQGKGCNACANTGYLGRVGLFEVMLVSDSIQRMLANGASPQEIETQAVKEGMISMKADGMAKVKAGITTPSEVIKSVFSVQKD